MLIFSGTLFHTKCFLFFSSNFAVKVGCVFKAQRKGTSKCTPFCNGKNMQKHLKYASRHNYLL